MAAADLHNPRNGNRYEKQHQVRRRLFSQPKDAVLNMSLCPQGKSLNLFNVRATNAAEFL